LAVGSATGLCSECKVENEGSDEKLLFEADLLNALGQAVIATNLRGKIVYWNHAAEELVGWSRVEMVHKNMKRFFTEIFFVSNPEIMGRIWSREPWTGEITIRRRDGEFLEVIMLKTIIFDGSGKVSGVVGVLMDISNLKWMQQITEDVSRHNTQFWSACRLEDSMRTDCGKTIQSTFYSYR